MAEHIMKDYKDSTKSDSTDLSYLDIVPMEAVTSHSKFDLKFLLVGDSGAGKTHLCGTYTLGPVHFYMIDAGGEHTLNKLLPNRPSEAPITITYIRKSKHTFEDFWKAIQRHAADGFYDDLASRNGLVVLPDSITSLDDLAIKEIARQNNRRMLYKQGTEDKQFGFGFHEWGMFQRWFKELVTVIGDIPCAVASTAHLHTETDQVGNVIGRYIKLSGSYRYDIAKDFDEVYLLDNTVKSWHIFFRKERMFLAKTRTFACPYVTNVDMNFIAKAYMAGDTLKDYKGGEQTNQRVKPIETKILMPTSGV